MTSAARTEDDSAAVPSALSRRLAIVPLSYGQRSLWFLYQMAPKSSAYNLAMSLELGDAVDADALGLAVQTIINRHASLRSVFVVQDGQPACHVVPFLPVPLRCVDASTWSDARLLATIDRDAHKPFDIERGPCVRAILYEREKRPAFLFGAHHLVADLMTFTQVLEELADLYPHCVAGERPSLTPPPVTFADFVTWQQQLLDGPEGERVWSFWSKQLGGPLPTLALPTDKPRPPVQSYDGASFTFRLERALSNQVRALAKSERSTLFTVLLAAFAILLHAYEDQPEVLVGTPVPGRRGRTEFETVAGSFVNILVLRLGLGGDPTFRELLTRATATVSEARDHQEMPFPLLVEKLRPPRDLSRSPIFQAYFTLQRLPPGKEHLLGMFMPIDTGATMSLGDLPIKPLPITQQEGQMDVALHVYDHGGDLYPELKYNVDLFKDATARAMADDYVTVLMRLAQDPGAALSSLVEDLKTR